MKTESIFIVCTKCGREIRQLVKDLLKVRTRVCPDCGTSNRVAA